MSTATPKGTRYTDEEIEEILASSSARGVQIVDQLTDEIRETPLLSVGIAFVLGILLGVAATRGFRSAR